MKDRKNKRNELEKSSGQREYRSRRREAEFTVEEPAATNGDCATEATDNE